MGFLYTRKKVADAPDKDPYKRQKRKLPEGYQIEVVPNIQWGSRQRYHWKVMKENGMTLEDAWADSEKEAVEAAVQWAVWKQKNVEHTEGRRISF